jgi:hypothetical protein
MVSSGSVYRDGANYISPKNDMGSIRLMVVIVGIDLQGSYRYDFNGCRCPVELRADLFEVQ